MDRSRWLAVSQLFEDRSEYFALLAIQEERAEFCLGCRRNDPFEGVAQGEDRAVEANGLVVG